jgi:hypothetical protein
MVVPYRTMEHDRITKLVTNANATKGKGRESNEKMETSVADVTASLVKCVKNIYLSICSLFNDFVSS